MSSSELETRGLVQIPSRHSFDDTVQKLRDGIARRGLTLFALIDHRKAASEAGLSMPPTQVVLFGSPRAGTPLMVATPSLAIDLPLRILVAADEKGAVGLTYATAEFLIARYGLQPEAAAVLGGVRLLAAEAAS